MGVFSRMSDIINANINSMLDKAEDPEKIARLIVQEMEETLVEVRTHAARAIADRKALERRGGEFRSAAREWEAKAELAIDKGREDLARGALAAKQKAERSVEVIDEELQRVGEAIAKADEDMSKLQDKLREAKSRLKALTIRSQTAEKRERMRSYVYDSRVDDVFARYEQVQRRVEEREARVEAYDLGKDGQSLESEFERLEASEKVEEELRELKRRRGPGGGSSSRPTSYDDDRS